VTTQPTTAHYAALSDQHAKQQDSIITAAVRTVQAIWSGFSQWHEPNLVAGRAAASASQVDAAMILMRRATRAHLQTALSLSDAAPRSMPALQAIYPRANVTSFEVYQRPATAYAYAGSQGQSAEDAARSALARLATLTKSDLRAADRDETQRIYTKTPKVIGYRRVLHPELSKTGSCGLCIVASHQTYHVGDLLPLHFPSCECQTLPITAGHDPGSAINDDDLAKIYSAAGGTDADSLRQTRIRFDEHGELGPVLVREGDHFTTAKDLDLPQYRKPDLVSARANGLKEIDELTAAYGRASAAADAFDRDVPAASRTPEQRQQAFLLQRSYLDIAARKRQLQAHWGTG
jgi:hypothetical protein